MITNNEQKMMMMMNNKKKDVDGSPGTKWEQGGQLEFHISREFTFFYILDSQVKATHVVVGDKVDAEDLLVEIE